MRPRSWATPPAQTFDTGDTAQAFLRSRGLIARDAAGLERLTQLAVSEDYLVAARIRLGTLLDLVATFLDTLDMLFDLYQDEPVAEAAQAGWPGGGAGGGGRGDGELGAPCHAGHSRSRISGDPDALT